MCQVWIHDLDFDFYEGKNKSFSEAFTLSYVINLWRLLHSRSCFVTDEMF